MIGFRTAPMDSTGVAHILEHTSLCGSAKYPVRDPFFLMLRRTAATFMNAMTASDWTSYPFATTSETDYKNLLDIYLDAVFHCNLDELDFAQEGHRLEREGDALQRKGVVYNEMKGAMSSPTSRAWQAVTETLHPETTYHYNSGGDPATIPSLSYDALLKFHRTHYTPSNAVIMTAGPMDPALTQQAYSNCVASLKQHPSHRIAIPKEQRLQAPVKRVMPYPAEDASAGCTVLVGWLMGDGSSMDDRLDAQLLSAALLQSDAAPLMQVLVRTDLGTSPGPLNGLDTEAREMRLLCSLDGVKEADADAAETLILDTIAEIAKDGVDHDLVLAALHQMELAEREVGGDDMPFGLELALDALPDWVHGGDVLASIDVAAALTALRERAKNPDYIATMVRKHLRDNPHRATVTLVPSHDEQEREKQTETQEIDALKSSMTDAMLSDLDAQASRLAERQAEPPKADVLPMLSPSDVDLPPAWPTPEADGGPCAIYRAPCNGLVQISRTCMAQTLSGDLSLSRLVARSLKVLGHGKQTSAQTQMHQLRVSSGVDASISVFRHMADRDTPTLQMALSTTALAADMDKAIDLLQGAANDLNLKEEGRIKEQAADLSAAQQRGVAGQGHQLAMTVARATLRPAYGLTELTGGMTAIKRLKSLVAEDDEPTLRGHVSEFLKGFEGSRSEALFVADPDVVISNATRHHLLGDGTASAPAVVPASAGPDNTAWIVDSTVQYCAQACVAPTRWEPGAAAFAVLAPILTFNVLHQAIRERGGAYGGGASYDPMHGSLAFFSYRDPHLTETFDHFRRALEWAATEGPNSDQLNEGILSMIRGFHKPKSPMGERVESWAKHRRGHSLDELLEYRSRVLSVTTQDVQDAAKLALASHHARAALAPASKRDELAALQFTSMEL